MSAALTKLTLDGLLPGVGDGESSNFITPYVNLHVSTLSIRI